MLELCTTRSECVLKENEPKDDGDTQQSHPPPLTSHFPLVLRVIADIQTTLPAHVPVLICAVLAVVDVLWWSIWQREDF